MNPEESQVDFTVPEATVEETVIKEPSAEAEVDLFGEKPPAQWPWLAALEDEMAKGTKISVPQERMDELFAQHPELKAWTANVRALATRKAQQVSAVLKTAQTEQAKAEHAAKLNVETRESLHRELARVRAIVNSPKLQALATPPPKPAVAPDPNSVEGLKYYGRTEVSSMLKDFLGELSKGAETHLAEIKTENDAVALAQLHEEHVRFFSEHNDAHALIDTIESLMEEHKTLSLNQAYELARAKSLVSAPPPVAKAAPAKAPNPRAEARQVERAAAPVGSSLIPPNWDKLTGAQQNAAVQRDPRIAEELFKRSRG